MGRKRRGFPKTLEKTFPHGDKPIGRNREFEAGGCFSNNLKVHRESLGEGKFWKNN